MIRIPESYVCVVTETTFDHHEDEEGKHRNLSVHATAALANAAVKEWLHDRLSLDDDEEVELVNNGNDMAFSQKDGLYEVSVDLRWDELFSFTIKVERMELEGGFPEPNKRKDGGKTDLTNNRPPAEDGTKKRRQEAIVLD